MSQDDLYDVPYDLEIDVDPYPTYRWLRDEAPLYYNVASPHRVGAETSKTRATVLDAAERVRLDDGYAAGTHRSIAGRAGVTGGDVA